MSQAEITYSGIQTKKHKFGLIARSYVNTPFKHHGRSRQGLDCGGLLDVCLADLGLLSPDHFTTNYSKLPMGDEVLNILDHHPCLKREPNGCRLQDGFIVALEDVNHVIRHTAIVTEQSFGVYTIIHAFAPNRKVVEQPLDDFWRSKIRAAYSVKG